jgi:hypothetical protein
MSGFAVLSHPPLLDSLTLLVKVSKADLVLRLLQLRTQVVSNCQQYRVLLMFAESSYFYLEMQIISPILLQMAQGTSTPLSSPHHHNGSGWLEFLNEPSRHNLVFLFL